MYKGERDMLKELQYGTVLLKVVRALIAAVVVVLGVILLMGINLVTCNPVILAFGVISVTVLFCICSFV